MGHPFHLLLPSQRLLAAARKAGVRGDRDAIDAWAKASGYLKEGKAQ